MNLTDDRNTANPAIASRVAAACDRIAPTWPLDQFIAVNPYWGWRAMKAPEAAATLAARCGTSLTMPRAWYRDEWAAGRLSEQHVAAVAAELADPALAAQARAVLHGAAHRSGTPRERLPLITDVRDLGSPPRPGQRWTDVVVHQIGQHCAAHFDQWQGTWHPPRDVDLFAAWRHRFTAADGLAWNHPSPWRRERLDRLPGAPLEAIASMLDALQVPESSHEAYLGALLLSVNGWAAWCAYGRWQARLGGEDDDALVGLLAIRLAWEWLLHDDAADPPSPVLASWALAWADAPACVASHLEDQQIDWVLQTALERTYQDTVIDALGNPHPEPAEAPVVQAVFCIDVRSEVFRRSLESVTASVTTRGFAGFFGLPISYTPAGSALTRPQLPGLLAPSLAVDEIDARRDAGLDELADERSATLAARRRWSRFRRAPSSMFSFVETMGLAYGVKLVKDSLAHTHAPPRWEDDGLPARSIGVQRPRLRLLDEDPAAAADLARRVLQAMGLTEGFAPIVLLCGHGSSSANNPHAAGLDCGACGGQTGEVNARVLAGVLNSPTVREHLAAKGTIVPPTTWFVPALHDTTVDEVRVFDTENVPDTLRDELAQLRRWLDEAGARARAERADSLALGHLRDRPDQLERAVRTRSNDWSQVRPEWGLAGNAAFIVAPRARTRKVDLRGRCFLHDYDWRLDHDGSVLTLIMTAPMVVTNWINLQYLASTVDNPRYGSGNKVLHNVVGGRIGVFEGNGGDLRIGLPLQSLHDGHALRHAPLRLSVFIEAPRDRIDAVIDAHEVVRDLVANAWLHLLCIEPTTGRVERWTPSGWMAPICEGSTDDDPAAR